MKALLCDLDGTLLDTTEFVYQTYEHALTSFSLPVPSRAEMSALMGGTVTACYRRLAPRSSNIHALIAEHMRFQLAHIDLVRVYPGVFETIAHMRDEGVRLGVLTARGNTSARILLSHFNLLPFFEIVVTEQDVRCQKPDPECVLKARDHFDMPLASLYLVGDTDVDMLTGRAAGIQTVGVTYGFFGERIRDYNPTHVISNFSDLLRILRVPVHAV